MRKKHFIAIAETIRTQIENLPRDASFLACFDTVITTANRLCDVFADENPQFDRVRFLAACGINR